MVEYLGKNGSNLMVVAPAARSATASGKGRVSRTLFFRDTSYIVIFMDEELVALLLDVAQ